MPESNREKFAGWRVVTFLGYRDRFCSVGTTFTDCAKYQRFLVSRTSQNILYLGQGRCFCWRTPPLFSVHFIKVARHVCHDTFCVDATEWKNRKSVP